ncbi:MAG: hypothetical protein DRQ24_09180, partial [Candidatus Latescibacterota bacterium]
HSWRNSAYRDTNGRIWRQPQKSFHIFHIKNWPEEDHPREMLLEKGLEALSDAALLAILLRTGERKLHYAEIAD